MLEFYQERIKNYAHEIEIAKTDKQLTDGERKVKISEFVEKEHKFILQINKYICNLKIVANCTA